MQPTDTESATPAPYFTFTAGQASQTSAPRPAVAKKNKRYRPPGPPFHDKLCARNGRIMRIRLEVPDPSEECPLTLAPMSDDALEFLQPTTTWFQAFPAVRKMVLPCGHSFGALNILYHFARRNMLCPCCRSGLDSPVSHLCMPPHLRLTLSAKVDSEARREVEEQTSEDAMAAVMLAVGPGETAMVSVFPRGSSTTLTIGPGEPTVMVLSLEFAQDLSSGVELWVEFYEAHAQLPSFSTAVHLEPTWATLRNLYTYNDRRDIRESRRSLVQSPTPSLNNNAFALLDNSSYSVLEEQMGDNTISEVSFTVNMSMPHHRLFPPIEVAKTGRVALQRQGGAGNRLHSLDAGHGSKIRLVTNSGDSKITELSWVVPDNFLWATGIRYPLSSD